MTSWNTDSKTDKGFIELIYDCVIVGSGIAGLQAAIQLGRYHHRILVVDAGDGRSSLCRSYHNVLGWPNGISGPQLKDIGRQQADKLGVDFITDEIQCVKKTEFGFTLHGADGVGYEAKRLLLATGIVDRIPEIPGILPLLGTRIYVCPDCDGYEVTNRQTIVIGAGNVGAEMALTLRYWTDQLIYINHEQTDVNQELRSTLQAKRIEYIAEPATGILADDTQMHGVRLESGKLIQGERGFVAFGGNVVRSALAAQLGVSLQDNRHIVVDARTKMTDVPHVWAVGDVAAHSEQVTIAMGDGSQAAIWIHKSLMEAEMA